MRATLIQCTKTKRSKPAPAKELYDKSGYFRDMVAYAEAQDNPYYILSARYGLVDPEAMIEPYDARGLSDTQAVEIADELAENGIETVELVAGRDYANPLVPELESHGIEVINNLRGCRIGTRRKRLSEWTHALKNESIC